MQDYNHFKLEDFLADREFCHWALDQNNQKSDSKWSVLKDQNSALRPIIDQAVEMIRYAHLSAAPLPKSQMDLQIARILKDARSLKQTPLATVKPLFPWKKVLAAASIAVIIGSGWLAYLQNHASDSLSVYHIYVDSKRESLLEVINLQQNLKTFELPDKSKIMLYPKSRLSYEKVFGQNGKREVYLEGKAFFLVQKNENLPFFVYANGLLTRVVGTSFQVETTMEGANVEVKTGKVAVMPVGSINGKGQLGLTPNQQASFSNKENTLSKSIVEQPLAIKTNDIKPDFEFVNQPMPKVFERLHQVYGIEIVYNEAVLKDCYVDATFSNESFFTKLDILCKTIGATYQNADGRIIVSSQGCR